MNTQIDHKEFGLSDEKAQQIAKNFLPLVSQKEGLVSIYDRLIKSEITSELTKEARDLRLKLQKLRTSIDKTHKAEKAFYLAGGRFVDAWKNKNIIPIQGMERDCKEIEDHYINIERERIEKLKLSRLAECEQYEPVVIHPDIEKLTEEDYKALLNDYKVAHEYRIEQKRKEEEAERLRKEKMDLHNKRVIMSVEYKQFWPNNFLDFSEMNESDFEIFLNDCIKAKESYDLEQQKIREENEKTRLLNEKRALRANELQPYIMFIRDYEQLINENDKEYKIQFDDITKKAEQHWERERKQKQKAHQAQLELQRIQREKEESERKERERIEKEKLAQELEIKRKLLAPDKEKLIAFNKMLSEIEYPVLRSSEMQNVMDITKQKIEELRKMLSRSIQ